MHVTKPGWLHHDDDKKKLTAIFSVDFDPTGARLATAGMDNKIRLWNPKAFNSSENSPNKDSQKLLAILTAHTGAVLCVRFSNNDGKFLVSSADDMVILIWEQNFDTDTALQGGNLDQNKGFGSDDTVEQWRPVRRLTGHESDVVDVAWAPNNEYLASCGLDNNIFIWDGQSFDKLHKITGHSQFVKGLSFDPTGELLASQSDDRTMKIWKTSDWSLESTISEPFENSQFSTYFRRPSWSPDGCGIVAANAVNGSSPVVSVISRKTWKSELSLVGHRAAIEAVRYNSKIFKCKAKKDSEKQSGNQDALSDPNLNEPQDETQQSKYTTICAAGSQDRSVSIWLGSQPVPLVVVDSLFIGNIMDLSWCNVVPAIDEKSSYTSMLAVCSYDGTVAILFFNESDIGGSMMSAKEQQLLVSKWSTGFRHNSASEMSEAKAKLKKHKKDWGMDYNLINIVDSSDNETSLASDSTLLSTGKKAASDSNQSNEVAKKDELTRIAVEDNSYKPNTSALNNKHVKQDVSQVDYTAEGKTNNMNGLPKKDLVNEPSTTSTKDANSLQTLDTQVVTRTTNGKKRVAPTFLRSLGGATPAKKPNQISQGFGLQPTDVATSSANQLRLTNLTDAFALGNISLQTSNLIGVETLSFGAKSVIEALGFIGKQLNQLSNLKAENKNIEIVLDDTQFSLIPNAKLKPTEPNFTEQQKRHKLSINIEKEKSSKCTPNSLGDIILEDSSTKQNKLLTSYSQDLLLPTPRVLQTLIRKSVKTNSTIVCENSTDPQMLSKVSVSSDKNTDIWNCYLSSPITIITANEHFIALGCDDSTLHLFSNSGLRICPPISTEAQISFLGCNATYCHLITSTGLISVWDTARLEAIVSEISIKPMLKESDRGRIKQYDNEYWLTVTRVSTNKNGLPIVILSNGAGYSYCVKMRTWMRISNPIDSLVSKLNNFWSWNDGQTINSSTNDFDENTNSSDTSSDDGTNPLNSSNVMSLDPNSVYFKGDDKDSPIEKNSKTVGDESLQIRKTLYNTQLISYLQWSNYLADTNSHLNSNSSIDPTSRLDVLDNLGQAASSGNQGITRELILEKVKSSYGKQSVNEITLSHIEHQLLSSIALDSSEEVFYWTKMYARWLSVYGTKKKITDLFASLLGPPNLLGISPSQEALSQHHKGLCPSEQWNPFLAGIPKRELLGLILPIISSQRSFAETTSEFSVILDSLALRSDN